MAANETARWLKDRFAGMARSYGRVVFPRTLG